jgi:hypothetical protein|tara:strand:- start:169 stop:561 length:393 start_codon:yes stop_codon:yes gene_type:complete
MLRFVASHKLPKDDESKEGSREAATGLTTKRDKVPATKLLPPAASSVKEVTADRARAKIEVFSATAIRLSTDRCEARPPSDPRRAPISLCHFVMKADGAGEEGDEGESEAVIEPTFGGQGVVDMSSGSEW